MGEALDLDALVARGEFEDWTGDYKYELLALIERVRQLEALEMFARTCDKDAAADYIEKQRAVEPIPDTEEPEK